MRDVIWPQGSLPVGERTLVMGVLNVTPDSFSDGGRFWSASDAVEHGIALASEGADVLDVGGESTRPGAEPVGAEEEIARVAPVIEMLAKSVDVPIGVDTTKAAVARAALDAGAAVVNDVSAGRLDPEMLPLVAEREVPVILMHMRGEPRTMQADPRYDDVVAEVRSFLEQRAAVAVEAGVDPGRVLVDPGVGFGKTREHNLTLLDRLDELRTPGYPIVVGTSRKSFIGHTLDLPVDERLEGTLATTAVAILRGASIVRVHDVRANLRVARMVDAIARRGSWTAPT